MLFVANEIHVEAVQPASAEQLEKIKQMQAFQQQPLSFDEAQQTFVTMLLQNSLAVLFATLLGCTVGVILDDK